MICKHMQLAILKADWGAQLCCIVNYEVTLAKSYIHITNVLPPAGMAAC